MYNIYPNLKIQVMNEKELVLNKIFVYFSEKMENVSCELETFLQYSVCEKETNCNLVFLKNKKLNKEAYTIDIDDNKIIINASDNSGFYYACKTLKQMVNGSKLPITLKGVHIEDEPDLKIRGFMYDISRNKVAKLETLEYIVDIMSDLKMNHFELYVEGFSFEYKSFSEYLTKNAYIKVSEYKKLEKYCKKHCVDLVPNQNGCGHMTEWLAKDELKDLAELPGGMFLWGSHRQSCTLDPNDPRSVELVSKMYDDMLPISKSKYFNMNFDEPFELGLGKSKEEASKIGVEEVYIKYVNKIVPYIEKYNKQPMIWGDVLVRHNASLENMPKGMIYLDWGYEGDYPFDKHLKKLKDSNVEFMAAPGTTTWCGWLGRLYDWTENISNAIWNTFKLDGKGVLLTDWGDFGHFQNLIASLPPLVFTGLLSYRCKAGTLKQVRDYLNRFIFKDKNNLFADVLMDASSYYQFEKSFRGNGTVAFATMYFTYCSLQDENPVKKYKEMMANSCYNKENYQVLNDFFNMKKKQIALCDVDDIWKKELLHTINLIVALTHLNFAISKDCEDNMRVFYFEKAKRELLKSKNGIKKIWLTRNKISRLDRTYKIYDDTVKIIDMCLEEIKGGTNETKN